VAKYNVGVGDAFPVDQPEKPPPESEPGKEPNEEESRKRRRDYYRWGRSAFLFEATFILLAIWGALLLINGNSVRGLLIAAGITFGIAIVQRLFWRSHWERREFREDCRRRPSWKEVR
jgi:hypothetical protein